MQEIEKDWKICERQKDFKDCSRQKDWKQLIRQDKRIGKELRRHLERIGLN